MNLRVPFRQLLVQLKSKVEHTRSTDPEPPHWCLTAKCAGSEHLRHDQHRGLYLRFTLLISIILRWNTKPFSDLNNIQS